MCTSESYCIKAISLITYALSLTCGIIFLYYFWKRAPYSETCCSLGLMGTSIAECFFIVDQLFSFLFFSICKCMWHIVWTITVCNGKQLINYITVASCIRIIGAIIWQFGISTFINLFCSFWGEGTAPHIKCRTQSPKDVCQIWQWWDKQFGQERWKTKAMPMLGIWHQDCHFYKYTSLAFLARTYYF